MLNVQLDPQSIADIVNSAGGRTKPIIVVEECEGCEDRWFSQVQDSRMRNSRSDVATLCPKCRAAADLAKRRLYVRKKRQE